MGLIAFLVIYTVERLAVAKYYRLPPRYEKSVVM